jgi:hypothetical protein
MKNEAIRRGFSYDDVEINEVDDIDDYEIISDSCDDLGKP